MPINGFGWHKSKVPPNSDEIVQETGRYHKKAIELFGPERCMFESNFPVDKQSCSYVVLWNAFKKIAKPFSEEDKQNLFHDTAARAYKLQLANRGMKRSLWIWFSFWVSRPSITPFAMRIASKLDSLFMRLSGGRFYFSFLIPVLILDCIGYKSGQTRAVPLLYVHYEDKLSLIHI